MATTAVDPCKYKNDYDSVNFTDTELQLEMVESPESHSQVICNHLRNVRPLFTLFVCVRSVFIEWLLY